MIIVITLLHIVSDLEDFCNIADATIVAKNKLQSVFSKNHGFQIIKDISAFIRGNAVTNDFGAISSSTGIILICFNGPHLTLNDLLASIKLSLEITVNITPEHIKHTFIVQYNSKRM